jgi:hypothetical protein
MPVLYEIDQTRQRIHTRCVGFVTFDEVMRHFRTLSEDPVCPDRLDVLLDLSALTSLPEPNQLDAVSSTIGRMSDRVRFDACAVVAKRTVLFGLMRMFEMFAEDRFRTTGVFDTVDEASEWLETQRAETAS